MASSVSASRVSLVFSVRLKVIPVTPTLARIKLHVIMLEEITTVPVLKTMREKTAPTSKIIAKTPPAK